MYYTCLLKATGYNMSIECKISWMSCTEQRPDVEYIWKDGRMDVSKVSLMRCCTRLSTWKDVFPLSTTLKFKSATVKTFVPVLLVVLRQQIFTPMLIFFFSVSHA